MNGCLRRARTNLAVLGEVCREWWVRAALLAVALLSAGVLAGFRVNVTRSYPLGLYRVVGDASAVERGSVVIVCLPPEWTRFALRREILGPGHCEGGSYGLGKLVLAVGGDVVELRPDWLSVNGVPVSNGRTLERDSRGRLMPHHPWGCYRLRAGEVWLFSPRPGAFDSRYFGPVTQNRVMSVIVPAQIGSRDPQIFPCVLAPRKSLCSQRPLRKVLLPHDNFAPPGTDEHSLVSQMGLSRSCLHGAGSGRCTICGSTRDRWSEALPGNPLRHASRR